MMRDKVNAPEHPNAKTAKWIIPPTLQFTVSRFLSLYEYGFKHGIRTRPLIIVGERGTGKSLFTELFETRWKADHPGQDVTTLNAATFPETLLESELFGHIKGAFTGATANKEGLLIKGGLIILHEIGEMSLGAQAKLLTFLEDGKYRRLGENKIRNAPADIQIIATTNKPKDAFRPDFYDRFFIFRIPPMHHRRVDALYYLAWKSPEVFSELHPWEVLAFLSHSWPGGVREIERVAEEVGWFNLLNKDDTLEKHQSVLMNKIGYEHTKLNMQPCLDLYSELQRAKVDIKTLENRLNRYGLGVDMSNKKKAFPAFTRASIDPRSGDLEFDAIYGTVTYGYDQNFGHIPFGLQYFSILFDIDKFSSENLLEKIGSGEVVSANLGFEKSFHPTSEKEKCMGLQIRRLIEQRQKISKKLRREHTFSLSPAAYERGYYKNILAAVGGNVSEAARRVGLPDSTFRKKLKKIMINSEY